MTPVFTAREHGQCVPAFSVKFFATGCYNTVLPPGEWPYWLPCQYEIVRMPWNGVCGFHFWAPLSGKITLSIKSEVHNISHNRQRRTEPRPCVQKTFDKFRRRFWDMRADRQTTTIAIFPTPARGELTRYSRLNANSVWLHFSTKAVVPR